MNIVFLDAGSIGSDLDLSLFHPLGNFMQWQNTKDNELTERIAEADVIITNRIILQEKHLKNADRLGLIALTATGYNNVDTAYCQSRGIGVANVAGYSTHSVAQHTFAMLFYLLEHTRYYDDYIREEKYLSDQLFADVSNPWNEIHGKVWGIIGLGTIGRRVAEIAGAFGAAVHYSSTSGIKREEPWKRIPLDELLKTSDILSIHAPLHDGTRDLINREEFSKMKRNAILLNLGRGAIVNEKALVEALRCDQIAAAGLDVLTEEPPQKGSDLLSFVQKGKLLITPHNAWGSVESRTCLMKEVFQNIQAFQSGVMRNRVV